MQTPRNNSDSGGDFLSGRPNRRWSVRQKIHTPAYISVNPCEDGTIFGLNEVFDIGPGGLSFQSPEPLDPGSRVRVNLELSGAGEAVRATGKVIWSDLTGRTGVQLRRSSLSAPRRLDEYLFLNAITACAHYEAAQSGVALADPPGQPLEDDALPWNSAEQEADTEHPTYPELLACLSDIGREMDVAGQSRDSRLQSLAERALIFLQASGVAIAIAENSEMMCRACAGEAPGVGTRFQSGAGFSGECIRSGVLLHCDDTDTDLRVDHEACRALGIRSILAAPIRTDGEISGLIEVFSAQPAAFNRNSRIFLQRLAEVVANGLAGGVSSGPVRPSPPTQGILGEQAKRTPRGTLETSFRDLRTRTAHAIPLVRSPELFDKLFSSQLRRMLLLGFAAVILAGTTLLIPWMRPKSGNAQERLSRVPQTSLRRDVPQPSSTDPASELRQLRQLAETGDDNAQFALGVRYAYGDGVAQDYSTACRWFSLAADQGHVVAQATLGAYYWAGRGVPVDIERAYFWTVLAEAGGDQGSKFRLTSLASSMSHAEVVTVQDQANEWIRQHRLGARAAASRP